MPLSAPLRRTALVLALLVSTAACAQRGDFIMRSFDRSTIDYSDRFDDLRPTWNSFGP
jgi:hypothetical protein